MSRTARRDGLPRMKPGLGVGGDAHSATPGYMKHGRQSTVAFRQPKGWLLTASPRRNPRQPFRRTSFPRGSATPPRRAAGAAMPPPAPGGAPGVPWWRAMLDAIAAAPRRNRAPLEPADLNAPAEQAERRFKRSAQATSEPASTTGEGWRPVTERLDRQREQLASMDEHLRRIVELQSSRSEATAVYAPPA